MIQSEEPSPFDRTTETESVSGCAKAGFDWDQILECRVVDAVRMELLN